MQGQLENSMPLMANRRQVTKTCRNLEDAVELVNLRLSREQWLLHEKLGKYTPDGPHVYRRAVLLGTKQKFWSSVPQRHHDGRVRTQWRAVLACQTKVSDLQ